tara:strand:- start:837 stop:1721 length:885 start_codon:yes stop_codon:yes gene_type:complete
MSFYYINEKIGSTLKGILSKICHQKYSHQLNNIAVTWINYDESSKKGYGYGINNSKKIYPASVVKLVYSLAVHYWIENKTILRNIQVDEAIQEMLQNSSNDATSFIVDLLTGTTSGPSLEKEIFNKWKYQRAIINDWLKNLNWKELQDFNCCQKTWEDRPYGREKDFYCTSNKNRNAMTTDGTARIMEEIMQNISFNEKNINLKNCLFRELNEQSQHKDLNNQINSFLGEGLPQKIPFWSKAGLMSEARHDVAWWVNRNHSKTLLVVFTEGKDFANDNYFLPKFAKAIYGFIHS